MKKYIYIALVVLILFFLGASGITVLKRHMRTKGPYTAEELGIKEIKSTVDKDGDGIDDYTDIEQGALAYIATKPEYKSVYYSGGYPDDGCGVCTDVIWNAFKAAGYDLKTMVDKDIQDDISKYDMDKADPNIDFRRVRNLNVFFSRHAQVLTTDLSDAEQWQAGDIVTFTDHIAICSDKRNSKGIPYLIHQTRSGAKEADNISSYTLVGHYRWNGGK